MSDHDSAVGPESIDGVLDGARRAYDESTDFTLGVEEEYAICDAQSLDLVPRFHELEARAIEVGLADAACGELLASEIEFRTGRCERYADAVRDVLELRGAVAGVFSDRNLLGATSGTHPWADYREQEKIDEPYYRRLVERMQYVAHRNNTFGLHVHVGVRGADRAIRISDRLRNVQPLLLALSASSPFLDGRDSGLCSTRAMTFSRNFPRGNIAPQFGDFDGYVRLVRWLRDAGSIDSYGQMWWGARPHGMHGTVEFRMFDAQPDVRDTLALAALASGTIAWLTQLHDAGELPDAHPAWMVDENLWRATRWGTDAEFIDLPGSSVRPGSEVIGELIERARVAGRAADLGLDDGLDRAEAMLARGCSALMQRAVYDETGSLPDAYRSVIDQTMTSAGAATQA